MEAIQDFFSKIFNAIAKFILSIWNGFIDLLGRVFPEEFAYMIAIVILVIVFFAIFRAVITKR